MVESRAGTLATPADLVDVAHLVTAYYTGVPDPENIDQQVAFGTSGHRGSSLRTAFNETHILATTQAICDYRREQGFDGPLFIGRDTHGLSEPAWATALEVLAANDVIVLVDADDRYTPTPAVSHAIIKANGGRQTGSGLADGIVVTPSHNPPADGGFKYNPPHGGPADSDATSVIAARANELIKGGLRDVLRIPFARARAAASAYDFMGEYVNDLPSVVDIEAIRQAGVRIGADPLGGASVDYWGAIGERHGLELTVVNPLVDPTWRFMTLDWDEKIRMDCSSPSAMASLIGRKDDYDIATGNDADADRHGIVTPDAGLMNPNHYLAVAIGYLFGGARPGWPDTARIGKTLVSSSMIDRVAAGIGKPMVEVPVGFKWFVPGLIDGSFGFGGEESAGASFLRMDGSTWTTDKDGLLLCLLASEILAKTGETPSKHYAELVAKYGDPAYARVDAPANREQKAKLGALSPDDVSATELAGEPIVDKLTAAPGNGAKIGGLKVTTESAWFAARPSGTEDVYKIYAESFKGPEHLAEVQAEAREVVMRPPGAQISRICVRSWSTVSGVVVRLGSRCMMAAWPTPAPDSPPSPADLVDVAALVDGVLHRRARPRRRRPAGRVRHQRPPRLQSLKTAFNEAHILATTQAICEYRAAQGYDGPLFIGRDTHALSEPAWVTALEVLVANDVDVLVDGRDGFTPTPGGLARDPARQRRPARRAPASPTASWSRPSHNPPRDGGFKYNPPHGGPADTDATDGDRRPRQRADRAAGSPR